MEKDDNYSNEAGMPPSFSSHQDLYNNQDQFMRSRPFETSADNATGILTYFPANPPPLQPITSPDKLSFAEVMQFADFGPKLSLNRFDEDDEPPGIDPVYFLKFPVLNNERAEEAAGAGEEEAAETGGRLIVGELEEEDNFRNNNNNNINNNVNNNNNNNNNGNKRKRGRTVKTSEEVESQRMTHIAVERNRRKQMNEHLRVLRSLMPGSYVQRGDQASIIGGAIEFVRELEQLLQCLESQKRRRLLGEPPLVQAADAPPSQQPPFLPGNFPGHQNEGQVLETTAESKSCLADVEVKVVGFDAMIKILSRRRPGQLIKAIAALEDLQLSILHTNITTIEQTVLYSFNVKIASESRFTAEDIASSVQQIFSFIHANTGI